VPSRRGSQERPQGERPKDPERRSRARSSPDRAPIVAVEPPAESAAEALEPPPPEDAAMPAELEEENREAAVFQRLGPEALARLRARFAEVKARIAERQMDEPEREQLKERAERLNPDGWVTDTDVDDGLEQYEAVYESLRAVIGHARKRRLP
jgi:hypothetical protein